MNSHRIKTALTENGKLSLQNLPFKKRDYAPKKVIVWGLGIVKPQIYSSLCQSGISF